MIVNKHVFEYMEGHYVDAQGDPTLRQLRASFISRSLAVGTVRVSCVFSKKNSNMLKLFPSERV